MKAELFFTNIPYNGSDRELRDWIEACGIEADSIRIVRDLVSGASPAFAYAALKDHTQLKEAVSVLNGKKLRSSTIVVKESCYRVACSGDW